MSREIGGITITRVKIVDDNEKAREGMAFQVADANLEPIQERGPLPSLSAFVTDTKKQADAAVCDHKIRGDYASFNGAEAVAALYRANCPAVLCTRYDSADVDEMRRFRRYIPALLPLKDVNPDSIAESLQKCVLEFTGKPVSSRRPWRVLIRVDTVAPALVPPLFFVAVPGWNSKEVIRLPLDLIPKAHWGSILPGARLYAKVNKGADKQEDLYFTDFEFT